MATITAALKSRAKELLLQTRGAPNLSAEQQRFSRPSSGEQRPEVLIAAAGSGKTECLLARFEWTIEQSPVGDRLQIISFTNSAAHVFQSRFVEKWGQQRFSIASTLHSWVKHNLLAVYFEPEERVSQIITRANACLESWDAGCAKRFACGLHLFVDEAQDCDELQWRLLSKLQRLGARVVVVGDPRQAIFGFQGACPDGMFRIHNSSKWARLTVNRRSAPHIVALANAIMRCSLPQCPETGMESERAYEQRPMQPTVEQEPLTSASPVIGIYYVPSLVYWHLRKPLARILGAPRKHPACVLTWTNADVDRLHENIWLLGYETLALTGENPGAKDDDSAHHLSERLRPEADGSDLVHIRTVHGAKGEGYDTVLFHVRGYATPEEARDSFDRMCVLEKQEELRRYYVACTRAKRELHVFVEGSCAPLWWQAVETEAHALLERHPVSATSHGASRRRASAPSKEAASSERAPAIMDTWKLQSKHMATDSILTHLARAQKARTGDNPQTPKSSSRDASSPIPADASLPACTQAGLSRKRAFLADSSEIMKDTSPVSSPPSDRLRALQALEVSHVSTHFLFSHIFRPNLTRDAVRAGLRRLQLFPLDPYIFAVLSELFQADARLSQRMALPLADYLEQASPAALQALRRLMEAALSSHRAQPTAACRTAENANVRAVPPYGLVNGDVFRDAASGERHALENPFRLGHRGSVGVRHIAKRLREVAASSPPEPGAAGGEVDSSICRKRMKIQDSRALADCRDLLIDMATSFVNGNVTGKTLSAGALLCAFTLGSNAARTPRASSSALNRVLPYLGNRRESRVSLSLVDDCLTSGRTFQEQVSQARALHARLAQHHTKEELDACEINKYVEAAPYEAPGRLCGVIPLYVPSTEPHRASSAVFFASAGSPEATREDETNALVTAGLHERSKRHRVYILALASAQLFLYDMLPDEDAPWAATRAWTKKPRS